MAKAVEKKLVEAPPVIETEAEAPVEEEMITVRCAYPCKINGKEFHGNVRVTKAVGEVLCEMQSRYRAHEAGVHIGRNFESQRLLDGTLVIQDASTKQKV